jgi:hypothetical protein
MKQMDQIADVSSNFAVTNHGAYRSFRRSVTNLIPTTTQPMAKYKEEL